MRFLLDEMFGERVAELLTEKGHDALHVGGIGMGGAPDADVLERAAHDRRIVVTENAADFLPLLDQRQAAGLRMTPVLIARTVGRGSGGALHADVARAIDRWAGANPAPYAHAHWLA